MNQETLRVKGSIAPDGKDVQPVVYDVDLEVSLPLRDVFAAFAMAGIIASDGNPHAIGEKWAAAAAYTMADAMLAQRKANRKG